LLFIKKYLYFSKVFKLLRLLINAVSFHSRHRIFHKNFYKMNETKYMTVKEYAEKYCISLKTVYNKIERGELKIRKVLNTTLIQV